MKFNKSVKGAEATVNHQGARAYTLTPEMELYAAVATTLLSNTSYEKADARLERIQALLPQVAPQFVAKLAVYARKQMNLRTAPLILTTELAKLHKGDNLVSKTIEQVVQRPDEIMELLACYQVMNKRTGVKKLNALSKQVQKGLAASFNRFDEYQFAKYDRSTEVKLKDALFLVHPKAKDEAQQTLFNKIVAGELATPYTWETALSALGQQQGLNRENRKLAVAALWEELIDSKKLGYMALLRNLRNILLAEVSGAHIEKVADYLCNEQAVLQSKQLPFRFLSAYRELKMTFGANGRISFILSALEKAVRMSIQNMQGMGMDISVVIACDVSGSMNRPVSERSSVNLYDVGLLLGMLLQSKCKNVQAGLFGDTWKMIQLPSDQVLTNVDLFRQRANEVGLATNGYLVIADLISRRYIADKVVFFTDVQMWDSNTGNASTVNTLAYQWKQYKTIAPNAKLYLFDLSGYGNSPVSLKEDDVYLIAGWSDKVFAVLEAIESGNTVMDLMDSIEL